MEVYKLLPHNDFPAVTGREVRWLMRHREVTIKRLAEANQITQKRVRKIREIGAPAGFATWEIYRMVEIASKEETR